MLIKKQHGFSMIEVLVAVVVLVFGVLGMAGLQMQAINATEQGRYNSRAALQAASIATVIKANPAYWTTVSGTVSVVGTTVSNGPAAYSGDCLNGTVCTATQMAYYDLKMWGDDVAKNLPVGSYTVSCDSTQTPLICTVTISWYEKNVAGRNQDTVTDTSLGNVATGGTAKHQYQTVVTPIQKTPIT